MTLESTTTPPTGNRLGFGGIAVQYDRARPGYPEQLIDAILEYGLLGPGDPALDVGAGTGQATLQLAGRGLQMLALEPSAEMVAVANDRFAAAGADAHAIVGPFEQAELDPCSFSLICAATSWHWIDPAVRFQIAAGALAPGGVLAVLWTWPRWRATALRDELDRVYFRSGAPLAEMGPLPRPSPTPARSPPSGSGRRRRPARSTTPGAACANGRSATARPATPSCSAPTTTMRRCRPTSAPDCCAGSST